MPCRELDNLLYPYLDGELVEGDRIAIEGHLATCSSCRTQADREKQVAERHQDITRRRLELYQAQAAAGGNR